MIPKEYDSLYSEKAQKKIVLPKELNSQIPLDPRHPHQTFFRVSERATRSKETMIKLGWKVASLGREQVDLALFCLGVLQAELSGPFGFFASNREGDVKEVWMEWHILLSGASKDDNSQKNVLELSIFNFCGREVLPRLSQFIATYLDWDYMCSEDFQDTKVIEIFELTVKTPLADLLKKFRIGKNYIE